MRLGVLRRRLTQRASRSKVSRIWLDVFETSMKDDLPSQDVGECVIELLAGSRREKKLRVLYESVCAEFPDITGDA